MRWSVEPARRLRSLNRSLDRLVDGTSPQRNRAVDLLRAVAIVVVIVWHWALSVTHRDNGELTMPNPIEQIPLGWLLTWLGQVMPVFFIVGGYANLAAWDSVGRHGGGARQFLARRLTRLLRPTAVFVVAWAAVETGLRLLVPGYRPYITPDERVLAAADGRPCRGGHSV